METTFEMEFNIILKETTQFDFPPFSNMETRMEILWSRKGYLEEKIRTMVPNLFPNEERLKKIWEESVKYANEQFKSLSAEKRLNGFYLQELMHYYVEQLGNSIELMIGETSRDGKES